MAVTIPIDGPPVAVTLATTCKLVTSDGTTAEERARLAYISSDTAGATDIVRIVYSSSLVDAGALPATGFHEFPASTLPKLIPLLGLRMLIQGSSAFEVQVELRG